MSKVATPFPLGAYLGNPNGGDPAAEAVFETDDTQFTQLMGAAPSFIDVYIDQTKPISAWVQNAGWQAWSDASSPDARTMTPVIGLPMTSTAAGSPSADQTYRNFAAGNYDGVIDGMVQAWAQNGFTTQYWRPGWEMNIGGMPSYEGSDAATQADWIAAFRHIYTVLHAAGQQYGVNVQVIWNPSIINYDTDGLPTQTVYPGNQYVDVIGADVYGDLYPYGNPKALYDWDKSGQVLNSAHPVYDSSIAQWAADPVNLMHYYTDPAATQWSLDGSGGHSFTLQSLIAFAKAQGKPIAIAEAGAGSSADGAGVSDNPTFVQWLYDTLANSGVAVSFVNIWDSNGGGAYEFSSPSDGKPLEAAAWAEYFGADGAGKTACFCVGSRIMTVRGEVAVERLAVGDRVVTASGQSSAICWIGWRHIDFCRHPDRALAQPVRIAAGAFGPGCPRRDLLVSPEHAIFVDGVLIPARHLVGCPGIAIDGTIERTTYYHIELPRHDVLLAEGLTCESWLDTGNRSMFDNGKFVPPHRRERVDGDKTLNQRRGLIESLGARRGLRRVGRALASHHLCGARKWWHAKARPSLRRKAGAVIVARRGRPASCATLIAKGPVLDAVRRRLGAPPVQHARIETSGRHVISIPAGTGTVRLTSPANYVAGDRRLLGAAVSAIALDGTRIGLTDASLCSGFHDTEAAWRWTNGNAELKVDVADYARTLSIDVASLAHEHRGAATPRRMAAAG